MAKDIRFRVTAKDDSGKALRGVRKNVEALKSVAGRAGRGLGLMAAGAAAAAGPLLLLAQRSAQLIDQQQKFADSIGASQRNLVALQLAASETAGVTSKQVNKSLSEMTRRIGDATKGTGSAKEALDAMGLSAANLAKMAPAEQFEAISQSIQGLPGAAQQAKAAYDLFGRSGVELLNTLRQGPGLIDEYAKKADALGLSVSRVDAKKIEMANDAFGRAKQVFVGIGNQIAIKLAPLVQALSERFTNAAAAGGGVGAKVAKGFEILLRAVAFVKNAFTGLKAIWAAIEATIVTGVAVIIQRFAQLNKAIAELLSKIPGLDVAPSTALQKWANDAGLAAEFAQQKMQEALTAPISDADEWIAKLKEMTAEYTAQAEAAAGASQAQQDALGALAGGAGDGGFAAGGEDDSSDSSQSGLNGVLAFLGGDPVKEQQAFEQRQEILQTALDDRLITAQRFHQLSEQLEQKHKDRMAKINNRGDTLIAKVFKGSLQSRLQALTQFSAGAAQHNKTMFRINKGAAIANAIVSTYQGAAQALRDVPYPLNIAAAASVVAAGIAQVQAIRSTSFNGSGGGTTPSAAASTPVVNDTPVSSAAESLDLDEEDQSNGGNVIRLVIEGTDEVGEAIAGSIKVMVDEQDLELIAPGSRNAIDIREGSNG